MFMEINAAYILALLFFMTSAGYISTFLATQGVNLKLKLQRELLSAVLCVVLSSFFYGIMTIASNEKLIRFFWAAGFISYILFLPSWIRFTANMISIKNKLAKFLARRLLILFTFILSVICIISNNEIFVNTKYGNQFSYSNSSIFKLTVVYVFLLCIGVFVSHIKWWRESEMKRQRSQQRTFVILTFILAPIGFATDYFIPAFTSFTVPPLVSVLLFPASFQLFFSMRTNKTLSISVPNVAGYIFESSNLPTIVLDYKNIIRLANNAAYAFLGRDINGKNINEIILINEKVPVQSFFDDSLKSEIVTALTISGEKACDMMMTLERDKYNDAICKVIILRDITEINYRDKLLKSVNNAATLLLNSDIELFGNSFLMAMETLGKAAAINHIFICKNRMLNGERYYTRLYEWFGDERLPQDNELTVDISYASFPDGWEAALSNGKNINSMARDMVPDVQKYLSQHQILSFFLTPIFIQDQFWGFVGFNDCQQARVFTSEEEAVLHSGGWLFSNALLRHEMEREIEEVNKITKLMLDANPLCCELWDSNFNIIDCNEATIRFFNIKDKQVYIDGYHDFSPEFQPDGLRSGDKINMCIQKAFDEGSFSLEWIHQFLDGSLVPIEVTLVPVEYGKENIIAVYSRDLREHKKAMANIEYRDFLLNSMNQSASLLLNSDIESFEDAVYLSMQTIAEAIKVDCVYLWKNQYVDGKLYCYQVFEWSPQETLFADGQLYNYSDVVPGWEEILSKGNIINSMVRDMSPKEQKHLSPSGILSILVVPIFFEENFWGFIGFDDCLRERIFTKEEESILHSGSLVIANAFIRNEQIKLMLEGMEREHDLEIQKQMAQAASNAKTQFLANMSHEIRTPMNAIIGMSDLLLSENLDIRQHRYAEDIKISANALLAIINDILDLSKIQATKLNLILVHYNLKSFIDNISLMTASLINNKYYSNKDEKLDFKVEMKGNIPECLYGDDVRLRQVLLNILSNAVKYTKKGSITLTINFEDPKIYISVTDTGTGIPPEDLPILFDAFEQSDTEKNRNMQGTGLGLTITKSLVELMDGYITVESEYGKGSSFNLILPLVIGDNALIQKDNCIANIIYAPTANILVVDDREINLSVICGLLQHSHITADAALSGMQAIEMVKKKQYDLIFMDHMMPEMDGIEATKILRNMGISIPIVALTANAVSGAREMLLSAGMNDFLTKPIDKAILYNILSTWISAEKIVNKPDKAFIMSVSDHENFFWDMINKIKGLSVEAGLNIVSGQLDNYKNTLEITMREIDKSVRNLSEFSNDKDLASFRIEVHGLKGSLSNIGAMELASKARDLENSSNKEDFDFCIFNLPAFIDGLNAFGSSLKNAFEFLWKNQSIMLPPELKPILARITEGMANMDFSALYDEADLLDSLEYTDTLKDEIEKLQEAIMIMNYDFAVAIIERLLKNS